MEFADSWLLKPCCIFGTIGRTFSTESSSFLFLLRIACKQIWLNIWLKAIIINPISDMEWRMVLLMRRKLSLIISRAFSTFCKRAFLRFSSVTRYHNLTGDLAPKCTICNVHTIYIWALYDIYDIYEHYIIELTWPPSVIMIQSSWCIVSRCSLWKMVWRASMKVAKQREKRKTREPMEPTT